MRKLIAGLAFAFAISDPALAGQIEAGAPAQVFISADLDWMNYLEQRKLLRAGTRRNIVGNKLVLIAPTEQPGRQVWAMVKAVSLDRHSVGYA